MTQSRRTAWVEHESRLIRDGRPEVVRVSMLGDFRVSVGARTIGESEWRLKKAASLVKLLALAPRHRLRRERAMDLLWPDLDPEAAANNLHQALYVVRRTLDPTPTAASRCLRLRGEQLELCPEGPLWVDVDAFEEAADGARRSRDPAGYRAALDLYAGDLLPGDLYEHWTEDRREGLRKTHRTLLVELAELHEERKEFGPGIEALGRAVADEPAHEEAHVGLMRLYAISGRRGEALRQYERLKGALSREHDAGPGAVSRRLYEEIAAGRFPPADSPPAGSPSGETPDPYRHNLPVARTSFVGRERELVKIKRALAMTRLLTLTGTGGSGKTRLALKVAEDLAGAYADGAWLAELAPLSEETLVPQAIASALEVHEQPGRPLAGTLADHLRSKDLLLVLDNCEHLVEAAANLADALLSSCPRLRILVTSRETLGVAGETVWRVPSLAVPEEPNGWVSLVEEVERSEAARLFVERARSRRPGFGLSGENAGAVAEICRKLDGIPLAIELAAACVGVLSEGQIAQRLDDALRLLKSGRTSVGRHRTLRATLEWSHELLPKPEKELFRRLSGFAGGWTLEAAEAVGAETEAEGGIGEEDVLDLLSDLVDKSLVVTEVGTGGALRYRLLEPVRQYGREKLEGSGEASAVLRRHAAFFLALAEEAEPELKGEQQTGWLERLETEHDNIRAALGWFLERGEAGLATRLAGALGEFWRVHGHPREGLGWLQEAVLAAGGEDASPVRAKALAYAGWMAWELLDFERAVTFSEEALALSRKLEDKEGAAIALHNLGMVALYNRMRAKEALALFEESLRLWRELGDTSGTSRTLQRMGLISVVWRDFGQAQPLYEESIELARKAGDKMAVAIALWLGGLVALGHGDHERVKARCGEGLDLIRQVGNTRSAPYLLHVLAASAGMQEGGAVRSARLWGAAESLLDTLGIGMGPAEHHFYDPYIAAARARMDEEAEWEAAWAEGRSMTPEEAMEYALAEEAPTLVSAPERPPAGKLPNKLTRREEEIANLVARGLTNRRIASELTLSKRTVDNHVRNILKKLNLSSRSHLGAWVKERRLLEADRN